MKHTYIKPINSEKLVKELSQSSFKDKLVHVDSSFQLGNVTVNLSSALTTAEKTELDSLIASHTTDDFQKYVEKAIMNAQVFGNEIMVEYGAKNVIAGKSVTDVGLISERLAIVQQLLSSGSLHVALAELDNVTVDALISQAEIDEVKTKIQEYLGL
jgi:hypothetical protein